MPVLTRTPDRGSRQRVPESARIRRVDFFSSRFRLYLLALLRHVQTLASHNRRETNTQRAHAPRTANRFEIVALRDLALYSMSTRRVDGQRAPAATCALRFATTARAVACDGASLEGSKFDASRLTLERKIYVKKYIKGIDCHLNCKRRH